MQHRSRHALTALWATLVLFGVSACALCGFDSLEYSIRLDYNPAVSVSPSSFNTWARGKYLDEALAEFVAKEGVGKLVSRYGYQCARPAEVKDCMECYVCSRTRPARIDGGTFPFERCLDHGELQIRAEIGPGTNVRAMTYWRTP